MTYKKIMIGLALKAGLSRREIALGLGLPRSWVGEMARQCKREGS